MYGHYGPPPAAAQIQIERAAAARTMLIGSILGAIGLLFFAICTGMMVFPTKESDVSSGAACLMISLMVIVTPAVVMLAQGTRAKRRVDRLQTIAALGTTNARVGIQMLSTTLGTSAEVAMKLLLEAVNIGLVRGRMDMAEGVFISAMVNQEIREFHGRCPRCGAVVQVQIPPGGSGACPYCRQSIQ